MRGLRYISLLVVVAGVLSCKKVDLTGSIEQLNEDFEQFVPGDSAALLEAGQWEAYTLTDPANSISIDTARVHSGNSAVHFYAAASVETVSKCDIKTAKLNMDEGTTFHFSAWYYVEGSTENLFLVDFETNAKVSASPGIRIWVSSAGHLTIDRSKMSEDNIYQPSSEAVLFPTDRWVHLEVECRLSTKRKGHIIVWQDGQEVLASYHIKTNPTDDRFITVGTVGILNSLEVGITANGAAGPVDMWVDDISMVKL